MYRERERDLFIYLYNISCYVCIIAALAARRGAPPAGPCVAHEVLSVLQKLLVVI